MTAWTAFLQAILLGVIAGAISDGSWKFFDKTKSTYKVFEQRLGWADAAFACSRESARLVQIRSREENDFVLSLLKKWTPSEYWIGLHKLPNDYFTWEGGSPFLQNYMPFKRQDFLDILDSNICVAISSADDGEWKTRECEFGNQPKVNYYICERVNQMIWVEATTMPARIEEETLPNLNWEEWRFCGDGKMYKVFKSRLTFDEAAEECSEIGGRLGHIKTAREFNCVKEAFEPFNSWNTYWIGLKSTDGSLKWEDGSDYKKCAGCEPGWEYLDAKTAASEEETCYAAYRESEENERFHWLQQTCTTKHHYLCEISQPPPRLETSREERSWIGWDLKFKMFLTPKTFERARAVCQRENGRLALIKSDYKYKWIMRNLKTENGMPFWIGLHKQRGDLMWVDDEATYRVAYVENKILGHGVLDRVGDYCYALWPKSNYTFPTLAGRITGEDCNEKKYFICEKDY